MSHSSYICHVLLKSPVDTTSLLEHSRVLEVGDAIFAIFMSPVLTTSIS